MGCASATTIIVVVIVIIFLSGALIFITAYLVRKRQSMVHGDAASPCSRMITNDVFGTDVRLPNEALAAAGGGVRVSGDRASDASDSQSSSNG